MSKDYALTKIFVIESIPADETQTGEELFKDTIKPYNAYHKAEIKLNHIKAFGRKEFFEALDFVFDNIDRSDKIILHIEAHGSDDKKSLVLSSDEEVSWQELTEKLIPINKKLKNNLHLFIICCFGNYISQLLDYKKTAPFKSFVGSQYSILPHEIISFYTALYDRILKYKDPYIAQNELAKVDNVNKFFMKDLDLTITAISYGHLKIFFKSGSLTIIKQLYDEKFNINIDLYELQKQEDPIIYILDLFRKRFFYRED